MSHLPSRALCGRGADIPIIGLGGHEFGPGGRIRGLHDDVAKALTPGVVLPGFGGPERRALVQTALEGGVRLFDVTIDSEKDALGRVLSELGAGDDVLVQTRPDGFVYTYDPGNRAFLDRERLLREVERICGLLRRPRVDILNIGLAGASLDAPGYVEQLATSLEAVRAAGLVSHFACDTFSGESAYLELIGSMLFDILYVVYSPFADGAEVQLLPAARDAGMGIIVKEPFLKGAVFRAADAAGFASEADRGLVAGAVLRWILRRDEVSSVIVGVNDERELTLDLHASVSRLGQEDLELLRAVGSTDQAASERARRASDLLEGSEPLTSLWPSPEIGAFTER